MLTSCSRMEEAEKEKTRQRNCKGEFIFRNSDDFFYPIATPTHTPRSPYPWEVEAAPSRTQKESRPSKGSASPSP